MNVRRVHWNFSSRLFSLAALAVTLSLSPALAVVTPPTAKGVLSGTIVDWPKGTTGTLRLGNGDEPDLADAPIDASGHFSLQLPGPGAFSQTLARISELFQETSNLADPAQHCVGEGTAAPSTGHFKYFDLTAYVGDRSLATLSANTDPTSPRVGGTVTSKLVYFDVPTTLDGRVRCDYGSETYHGTFPAGWVLPKTTVEPGATVAVIHVTLTPDPLPTTLAWRLYDRYVGIGIQFNTPASGGPGFTIETVYPGRPAALAGVQANDLLVEIDGQDVTRLTRDEVTVLVRGGAAGAAAGTKVTLGVRRGSDPAIIRIPITRALITQS